MDKPKPPELEPIIKQAELELDEAASRLFSPEGFKRLNQRIAEFIGDLTIESIRVAKRHQSDSVSPAYVDRAAEHLASGKSARLQKVLEGLGSIILGIGLATAGSMVQTSQYTTQGVVLSIICIVVGMPAFLFHMIKD